MAQVNEIHPHTVRMPNGSVEIVNNSSDHYLTREEIHAIKTAPDATLEANVEAAKAEVVAAVEALETAEAAVAEAEAVEPEEAVMTDIPFDGPAPEAVEEPVAEVVEVAEAAEAEEASEETHARKNRRRN